ncbi:MAG TPA: hypothetical protein VGI12_07265 [Vicinamibacterales bacterium]
MHKARLVCAIALAAAGSLCLAACGGSKQPTSPSTGGGGGGGGSQTPPANALPVIDSFTVQGSRAPQEPANFADVGETIAVSAKAHDDDTPAAQLEYQWSATVGTFSGSGASVNWTAPSTASTPLDVTITLTLVDHYGFAGQAPTFTQSVSGAAFLSLHDSVKEVGALARQFLLDFSDSTVPVATVMRNFDPTCTAETEDVTFNRQHLRITSYDIGQPTVVIPFGNAFCTAINQADHARTQHGDACSGTPSHWVSTLLDNNTVQVVDGTDWITGFYKPALKAWKLCDSQFTGTCKGCSVAGASALKYFR